MLNVFAFPLRSFDFLPVFTQVSAPGRRTRIFTQFVHYLISPPSPEKVGPNYACNFLRLVILEYWCLVMFLTLKIDQ